jgi:uncharacterized protein YjiS (DUF1127 family)
MDGRPMIDVRGIQSPPPLENDARLQRRPANAGAPRARAVTEIVIAAGPAIDPPLRALGAWLGRRRRQRETHDALMRCSDRVLADIGIDREDIPLIAKKINPRERRGTTPRGSWHALGKRLEAVSRAWRDRRRVYRELMAHRDHELDDLGIRRSDIPAIARGGLPASA